MTGLVLGLAVAALAPSPAHVRELIEADRASEAVEEARSLAVSSPDDLDVAACLGEALYRAGRIEEAGAALEPLAARDGAPARALAQLGLVRAAQGRDGEAAPLLTTALATAPEDPWVLLRASGAAPTRAEARRILREYLARSAGEDPDRVEGAKGTLRLYEALGERRIWIAETRPERLEVRLDPLVGTSGRGWIVEAKAGKKTVRLLLDTGSTGLFVVERAVKKAGLVPLAEETVFAGGGSGRTRSSRGILPSLAIGDLVFRDALVTTTRDELDPQGRIHGVLGVQAFAGYAITLDLDRGRLVLAPPPAEAFGEPYWSVGGQMLVRAKAEAAPGDGLFLFDTGAAQSMISTAYAATIAGTSEARAATVRTYGGHVQGAAAITGVTLRFLEAATRGDGPVHRSDMTQRSRLGGVEIAGFLGLDALDGTIVRIDTARQRVAVAHPPRRS